jgi:hypothetical protein
MIRGLHKRLKIRAQIVKWEAVVCVQDSITAAPPRPETANLLSPPERRRAPISVDSKLRKHALDF